VLGVMPAALRFPREQTELWLPMQWSRGDRAAAYFRRAHNLRVVGRLAPGATVERADARLRQVALVLQGEHADLNRGMEAGAGVLRDYVAQKTRGPVLLLLGAVSLLLLTACANVANLVLVRGAARERELAVRGALGASRLRVTAQLVTESLVLTLLGGGVGMLLGIWGTRLLAAARPPEIELLEGMPLDGRVLLFAVGATALCALLFGSLPALRGARTNLTESLRHAQRTTGGRRTRRAAHALVMAEVALALLLVTGAGLLTRSLWRLARVDSGFDSENVLSFALSLPSASYPDGERVTAFFDAALARMRALPGVLSAGATTSLPLTGPRWGSDFTTEGWGPDRFGTEVHHREIAPGYLETLRVRLVRGRAFDSRDRPDAPLTVLINETLARRYYEGEDPIGKRITFDRVPEAGSVWRTIIGVVAPERQLGMAREPLPEFLAPLAQDWSRTQYLVLRTAGDPRLLLPAVRSEVGRLDASLPLFDVRTLAEVRSASFARERFVMALFGLFAALALLLTLVGVYGVSAQAAKARTREIGIRMALGAQRGSVQRMIVGQGMRLVAGGLALGLAGALAAGRFMRSLLVGVAATDAATYVAVCALLTLSALLASWLPARRAARVDPVVALRDGS
jgi:putative ABC transport system permease protein